MADAFALDGEDVVGRVGEDEHVVIVVVVDVVAADEAGGEEVIDFGGVVDVVVGGVVPCVVAADDLDEVGLGAVVSVVVGVFLEGEAVVATLTVASAPRPTLADMTMTLKSALS